MCTKYILREKQEIHGEIKNITIFGGSGWTFSRAAPHAV
jgi:hypothetical protein